MAVVIALAVALPVLVGACAAPGAAAPRGSAASPAPVQLVVFAAASLKQATQDAAAAYRLVQPGVSIVVSLGASSALRVQIEQGAPADLFLSADTANARQVVTDGLAAGPAVDFAGNSLTVVVPAANPAGITSPLDLARPGVRVVTAGPAVPIAKYADAALANLARQPGYPADFAARVAANVVSREEDVGSVLAKVELGEADAAIVYVTDARAAHDLRTIAIPAAANVPAVYAGVVLQGSAHRAAAAAFLAWLAGPAGQAVLGRLGFRPPA